MLTPILRLSVWVSQNSDAIVTIAQLTRSARSGKSVIDKKGRVGSEGVLKKGGVSEWSAIIKEIN